MESSIHLIATSDGYRIITSVSKRALRCFDNIYDAIIYAYELHNKKHLPLYVHDKTGRVEYSRL